MVNQFNYVHSQQSWVAGTVRTCRRGHHRSAAAAARLGLGGGDSPTRYQRSFWAAPADMEPAAALMAARRLLSTSRGGGGTAVAASATTAAAAVDMLVAVVRRAQKHDTPLQGFGRLIVAAREGGGTATWLPPWTCCC